jgi:hypothetical protein
MRNFASSPIPLIVSAVILLIGVALLVTAGAFLMNSGQQAADLSPTPPVSGTSRISIPTATPAPTKTATPTHTPIPPTATPTPATATIMPTATVTVAATRPAVTAAPRTNTPVSATTAATAAPTAATSSRLKNVQFAVENPTISVNQEVWFTFSITNASSTSPLPIGELGAVVFNSAGQNINFQESYSGFELSAGQVLNHRDSVKAGVFNAPGTYTVRLSVCYSSKPDCASGGEWELLLQPITITVQ